MVDENVNEKTGFVPPAGKPSVKVTTTDSLGVVKEVTTTYDTVLGTIEKTSILPGQGEKVEKIRKQLASKIDK